MAGLLHDRALTDAGSSGAGGAGGTLNISIFLDGQQVDGRVEFSGGLGNLRVALNQVAQT
jgi:hypothetical protein